MKNIALSVGFGFMSSGLVFAAISQLMGFSLGVMWAIIQLCFVAAIWILFIVGSIREYRAKTDSIKGKITEQTRTNGLRV